jgi:predicted metal-dependent hydrolase
MLMTMPKDPGKFVIVQELVHLFAPKHGRLFKLYMDAYLSDWNERERRLKEYIGAKRSLGAKEFSRIFYLSYDPLHF